jgi:hypothetical protein
MPALRLCSGHKAVSDWKKGYVMSERRLPFAPAPGQFVKLPYPFLVQFLPKLSDRDFKILTILLMWRDAKSGWTTPLSIKSVCSLACPPGRDTPIHPATVRECIKRMAGLEVEVELADKSRALRPLVEAAGGDNAPRRYRVNI